MARKDLAKAKDAKKDEFYTQLSDIEKEEGGIFATIDLEEMYNFRDKCRVLEDIKDSYEVLVR